MKHFRESSCVAMASFNFAVSNLSYFGLDSPLDISLSTEVTRLLGANCVIFRFCGYGVEGSQVGVLLSTSSQLFSTKSHVCSNFVKILANTILRKNTALLGLPIVRVTNLPS